MKSFFLLLIFFSFNKLISQEIIEMKEVYIDNNLVYKVTDNGLFSGIAQSKQKNEHLVYEEEYENGIILNSNLYYNVKVKVVSDKIIYNKEKPFNLIKKIRYGYSKDWAHITWSQITYYNENGEKILFEKYDGEILIYSCEYLNKKKHGTEFCINNDGTKSTFKYKNGKKIR